MTVPDPPEAFTWIEAQAGARALLPPRNPVKLLGGGIAATDAAIVMIGAPAAWLLTHDMTSFPREIMAVLLLAAVLTLNVTGFAGCYTRHVAAPVWRQIGRATLCWSAVFVLFLILGVLTKISDDLSAAWAIAWYAIVLMGIGLVRFAAVSQIRQWRAQGKLVRTVAVVDLAGTGDEVARRLQRGSAGEMRLVGVFTAKPAPGRKNGVGDLVTLARLFRIDEVVVVTSERIDETNTIVHQLRTMPADIRLCPELPKMDVAPRRADLLFGQPVLTVHQRPLTEWNQVAKRTEDLVLSVLALIVLAPLIAIIAILVKLDSRGPVVFRQQRLGFNNNVITVYKFRTMTHRPNGDLDVRQAQRHDPRVTRVGRILRQTSLDEMLQLFNVLEGSMSLVGPRPHALAHNEQYAAQINDYLARHRVQPGITGWAQVNGLRGETDTLDKMQRRVEHDLEYIDRWSLFLDLRILCLTTSLILSDGNAY